MILGIVIANWLIFVTSGLYFIILCQWYPPAPKWMIRFANSQVFNAWWITVVVSAFLSFTWRHR